MDITIGTEILVGLTWMIVDEITKTGKLWCIDQDGGEHEISESQVDSIINRGLSTLS